MRKGLSILSATLLILLLLTSCLTVYFYLDSMDARRRYNTLISELEEVSVEVNLLIDYGNGSRVWNNRNLLPIGSTLLNATLKVACSVDYVGGEYGVFVNGIDGVGTTITKKGYYWLWWRYDRYSREWVLGETGADSYIISRGDILAWLYEDTSNYPNIRKPNEAV